MEDKKIRKQVSKVRLLRGCGPEVVKDAVQRLTRRTVAAGEEVITAGQKGSSLFVLGEGQELEAVDPSGAVLHVFVGPCRLGERTLLRQDETCEVTCRAGAQGCDLWELSFEGFVATCTRFGLVSKVQLDNGALLLGTKSLKKNGVAFKGIRFGSASRYEPPELSVPPANSTLLCALVGPSCPQAQANSAALMDSLPLDLPGPRSVPRDLMFLPEGDNEAGRTFVGADGVPQRDDCLHLNVFTSKKLIVGGKKRPVMLFIHGGAFLNGSGGTPLYDGSELAAHQRDGTVVVTINYRLGALGFLRRPGEVSANLGLQDQLMALTWVQEHIASFGGDPENVTVFGESAGAMSIGALLGSRMRTDNAVGRPLFHKAILQSGAALNAHTEAQAVRSSQLLFEMLGISTMDELRAVPIERLLAATAEVGVQSVRRPDLYGKAMAFEPCVCDEPNVGEDPVFQGVPPMRAIAQGSARDVPCMIGVTQHEYSLFTIGGLGGANSLARLGTRNEMTETLTRRISRILNDTSRWESVENPEERARAIVDFAVAEQRKAAGKRGPGSARNLDAEEILDLVERINSTWFFELPCWRFAEVQRKFNDVFLYRLDFRANFLRKACHAIDLPLVFGSYRIPMLRVVTSADQRTQTVSKVMQEAWTRFATFGRPLDIWPSFDGENFEGFVFARDHSKTSTVDTVAQPSAVKTWDGICMSRL